MFIFSERNVRNLENALLGMKIVLLLATMTLDNLQSNTFPSFSLLIFKIMNNYELVIYYDVLHVKLNITREYHVIFSCIILYFCNIQINSYGCVKLRT